MMPGVKPLSMTVAGRHFRNFKQVHWEGTFVIHEFGNISLTEWKQNATPVRNVSGFMVWDFGEGAKCSSEPVWRFSTVFLHSPHTYLNHRDLSSHQLIPVRLRSPKCSNPPHCGFSGSYRVRLSQTCFLDGPFFLCPFPVFVFLCFYLWNLEFYLKFQMVDCPQLSVYSFFFPVFFWSSCIFYFIKEFKKLVVYYIYSKSEQLLYLIIECE